MRLNVEELLQRLEDRGFTGAQSTMRTLGAGSEHAPSASPSPTNSEPLPAQLGPFEVIGELGEGGFGVVLLGAQQRPVKRLAAIKLLKRGMDSRSVLARFRGEQQALALMDHPAVAMVFESGLAEDGRPWFAMPLVAGLPITHHADLERLGLRERLKLFRSAAEGVLHAHQKGVIHRDLKPANILVGVEGDTVQPRVIDFGIAKAVEGADPLTSLATMGESIVGTPAYMSPEQVAGQADVRSDVWALGVMLGELLCGARPLDRDPIRNANGSVEIAHFQRPSLRFRRWLESDRLPANEAAVRRGLTAASLMNALQSDLDAIVGHCLEQEPQRRYAGVGELIEDIDRHLDGRAVLARSASVGYQVRRFVARNRVAVGVAIAVAVALIAATIISVRSAAIAQSEAARARREALASQAVTDFLVQTFGAADPFNPQGQQDIRVRDALDTAAKRIASGDFTGEDAQAARIALAIGSTRLQLGLAAEALPTLDLAAKLFLSSGGGETSAYAQVQHRRALCLQTLGRLAEAETPMLESVALHERIDGFHSVLAVQVISDLALLRSDQGKLDQVEPLLLDALARANSQPQLDLTLRASITGNLGMYLQGVGRLDEAMPYIQATLDQDRTRLGAEAPELAMDYNNLGLLQKERGELTQAKASLRESIRIMRKKIGDSSPNIPLVQINLAETLLRTSRTDEAIEQLQEAATTYKKLYGNNHTEVARSQNMLGFAYRDLGKWPESEAAFREAVRVWKATLGNDHPDVAAGLNNIARALQDQGRTVEALPLSTESLQIIEKVVAQDDPRRWVFLGRRASILSDLGRWQEADTALQQSLQGLQGCKAPTARMQTVLEALVKCNTAWAQADPAAGRAAIADAWQQQLQVIKSSAVKTSQKN